VIAVIETPIARLLPEEGLSAQHIEGTLPRLFPTDLAELAWLEFPAAGFDRPVSGILYRSGKPPCCGLPLGGVSTGCLDIEVEGALGFSSVFTPERRRKQLLLPFLGVSVAGRTTVLSSRRILEGGRIEGCASPAESKGAEAGIRELGRVTAPAIEGVEPAREIHYWGHYPVADLEFGLDAPVSVGLRAWSPFIPGDAGASSIPGAVFEVHLRNPTAIPQRGTTALSFPGPHAEEVDQEEPRRQHVAEDFTGIYVRWEDGTGYALGTVGPTSPRVGGPLLRDGESWARIESALPEWMSGDLGASAAVDFELEPGEQRIVRFILAWHSPGWIGHEGSRVPRASGEGPHRLGADRHRVRYQFMYELLYESALDVARRLATDHESLLTRVLAWQQAIYSSSDLPVWLRETLVNNFSLIAEDSLWARPGPPLGDWAFPDGLFVLNESARSCRQIECIPCSFYGNFPIVFFFPQLARSTLRAYKQHLREDGAAPFAFSPIWELGLVSPTWNWQISLNGVCFVDLVDRMWLRTGDDGLLSEFYEAVKRSTAFTMSLRKGPEGVISLPEGNVGREWWEADDWYGMCTHIGGMRLSNLRIALRMAEKMGDESFALQCRKWYEMGSHALESQLWNEETRSYLHYYEPETGRRSDEVMTNQLDGLWACRLHGTEGVFRKDRVDIVLDTVRRTALIERIGVVGFTEPDGTPRLTAYGNFVPEALMLGMTFLYEGDRKTGLKIIHDSMWNQVITHRHPWDLTNIIRCDTGERTWGGGYATEYYQMMILWTVPAALKGQDIAEACTPGGLVDRVMQAGAPPTRNSQTTTR
jgi:uncharacterized protein (DUF608 family)